jgi:hypothetical protein
MEMESHIHIKLLLEFAATFFTIVQRRNNSNIHYISYKWIDEMYDTTTRWKLLSYKEM